MPFPVMSTPYFSLYLALSSSATGDASGTNSISVSCVSAAVPRRLMNSGSTVPPAASKKSWVMPSFSRAWAMRMASFRYVAVRTMSGSAAFTLLTCVVRSAAEPA